MYFEPTKCQLMAVSSNHVLRIPRTCWCLRRWSNVRHRQNSRSSEQKGAPSNAASPAERTNARCRLALIRNSGQNDKRVPGLRRSQNLRHKAKRYSRVSCRHRCCLPGVRRCTVCRSSVGAVTRRWPRDVGGCHPRTRLGRFLLLVLLYWCCPAATCGLKMPAAAKCATAVAEPERCVGTVWRTDCAAPPRCWSWEPGRQHMAASEPCGSGLRVIRGADGVVTALLCSGGRGTLCVVPGAPGVRVMNSQGRRRLRDVVRFHGRRRRCVRRRSRLSHDLAINRRPRRHGCRSTAIVHPTSLLWWE